jgi:hypothetical protein
VCVSVTHTTGNGLADHFRWLTIPFALILDLLVSSVCDATCDASPTCSFMGSSPGAMVYCYDENGVQLVSGDDKIDHDE